jgi:hypothetical protein
MSAAIFKTGDRARIKDCPESHRAWGFYGPNVYKAQVGEECEIVDPNAHNITTPGRNILVKFPNDPTNIKRYIDIDDLEPMSDTSAASWKVGDRGETTDSIKLCEDEVTDYSQPYDLYVIPEGVKFTVVREHTNIKGFYVRFETEQADLRGKNFYVEQTSPAALRYFRRIEGTSTPSKCTCDIISLMRYGCLCSGV